MTTEQTDLKGVAALLRRQARLIGLTTAILLGIALIWLLTVPQIYTSTGLVLVDPGQKDLLDTSTQGNATRATDNARVDSEVEILRSDAVALAVVDTEGLLQDPEFGTRLGAVEKIRRMVGLPATERTGSQLVREVLDRFHQAVSVRRRGLTYVIAVSVDSESPDRAAALSNAVAEAYIDLQVDAKIAASLAARDVLQGRIDAARRAIAASDDQLDGFIDRNLARIEANSDGTNIAALRRSLEAADEQRLAYEIRVRAAEVDLARNNWAGLSERLEDEALAQLQRQREELDRQLGASAQGTEPDIDLRAELDRLEQAQMAQADAALDALRGDIATLENTARDARARIREELLRGEISSEILAEVYGLQQEAAIARTQYQNLLSRMRDLETRAGIQIADSRIISPALPSISASFPNPTLILSVALFSGVALGIGLAFLNEYYVGGITSASQLRDVLRLPVAATVPLTPIKPNDQLSVADMLTQVPLSPYSEAIRQLRATLDQGFRAGVATTASSTGRIILVTSAVPAEGKSTTSLALARAYALAGKKTLLLDSDLRKPTLHKHLGLNPEYGFIDFLRDPSAEDLTATFCGRDPQTGLSLVLGSGRAEVPTDQLLNSETFDALMRDAARAFDVVIVDTPPVLPVVDVRYMAQYADAVVMVVRFAVTNQGDLRQAAQTVQAAMAKDATFVTVLGHHPSNSRGYRIDDYYGYSADPAD